MSQQSYRIRIRRSLLERSRCADTYCESAWQTDVSHRYSAQKLSAHVHQKEDDPTLQITVYVVDHDSIADIQYLDVGERGLLNWLIRLRLHLDSIPVIFHGLLRVPSAVLVAEISACLLYAEVRRLLTSGLCNLTARMFFSTTASEQIVSMNMIFLPAVLA